MCSPTKDGSIDCSLLCPQPSSDTTCVWVAGGGPSGLGQQIIVRLPRKEPPSLHSLPMLEQGLRICADKHLPLGWFDAEGKSVEGSWARWVVSSDDEGVSLTSPALSLPDSFGRHDWAPSVTSGPEAATRALGACVYDTVERNGNRWLKESLAQLSTLRG